MRRVAWFTGILLLLWGWDASAAHGQSVAVTVQADVENGLSVFIVRSLNFGTVASRSGVATVTLTSANNGLFRLYGQRNKTVNVTLTPPTQLSNGTHTIPVTSTGAAYNELVNNPSDANTVVMTGTTAAFKLRENQPGNAGQAYLWVYGSINVGAVSAGRYTGTWTLSAVY